ncbi:glutamate synthase (NADPH/NADH) small chain [Epibacterium ulvae]|uniref:Glutamate synthase (NADPH/NADH) small chain n=1 Tax=Epibacterium ulvae TaxID=1156985 RepID=A0A1G5Q0P7_9RHOB|nr:NAD(P)-dependent oxidoreductase [Epibacterium ulvae]SCZ55445.1 glutamate synthase (NADPH/NADH) small chain [Epibacterium ulvae]
MAQGHQASGIQAGRLAASDIAENFADLHPAYETHEAMVAADRCYFCHDAPCMTACPTSIDIPQFIREIQGGHPESAARTILDQNILGGMCARVCPTETLCEQVCVREVAEGKPVEIGRLQRYATDALMACGVHPFDRAEPTGKRIAVVGAGPAGLSAAHRLAMLGHDVELFEGQPKAGGLNEFGIAAYKSTNDFAAAEVDWLLQIGGITVTYGKTLGGDLNLEQLKSDYDAVFLSIGLGGVNALRAEGEDLAGVADAVDFIAKLRQSDDLSTLPVGRDVVVIGGGMTAVDAAVQSKLLGAENVTIAYRRDQSAMGASRFEQDLAATKGVKLMFNVMPKAVLGTNSAEEVELERTEIKEGRVTGTGETLRLKADQVFKAIGQTLEGQPEAVELSGGKIKVDAQGKTSVSGVWAGGDCASGGEDLTVTAVAEGRDAAMDIHQSLMG